MHYSHGKKFLAAASLLAVTLFCGGDAVAQLCCQGKMQLLKEPGSAPGVRITNIGHNRPDIGSAYAGFAISPKDGKIVVAWRRYSLPINTNLPENSRTAECHVAISDDGGKTFKDRNLMDVLATAGSATEPRLPFCNGAWAAVDKDGVIYSGGEQFTAGGLIMPQPKQGRAGVTVSHDGGKTWSKMVPSLLLSRLAPGPTGVDGGMKPENTPWDDTMGVVDQSTGTLYASAESYFATSDDKGKTFGTVYNAARNPDWPGVAGYMNAANGIAAIPYYAAKTPIKGRPCPCLVLATTNDKGAHFTYHLIADSTQVNDGDTSHTQVAVDNARPGHFAVTAFSKDHINTLVYSTIDGGKTWVRAMNQPYPPSVAIIDKAMVNAVAYTPDGHIVTEWHAFREAGAYDIYAAMGDGKTFGPTVKITPEPSVYPPLTQVGNGAFGGGDYTSWIAADDKTAYMLFSYSPKGLVQDTVLATVPLSSLR